MEGDELLLDLPKEPDDLAPGLKEGIGLAPQRVLHRQVQALGLSHGLPLLSRQRLNLTTEIPQVPLRGTSREGEANEGEQEPADTTAPGPGRESMAPESGRDKIQHSVTGSVPG